MYKRDSYIWVTETSGTAGGSQDYSDLTPPHVDPPINGVDRATEAPAEQRLTHKPYVPPTDITVENAGRIKGLEAPLG
jgi:hypothetical protein